MLKPTFNPFPIKKELQKTRRTSGSEDFSLLNFLDFFSTVGHMKATIFWNKGGG
jgi:hypothetical protein